MKHTDAKMCPVSFRICTEFFMKQLFAKTWQLITEDVLHEIRGYAAYRKDIQLDCLLQKMISNYFK